MTIQTKAQDHVSPLAGKPAPKQLLVDLARLERAYYETRPDVNDPNQLVGFGTSGHRGSSLRGTFNEAHILAITQAICEYRSAQAVDGPLYMGKDTHALSGPAQRTALEVLAANGVETFIQQDDGVTPTPVISHAILIYNRGRHRHHAVAQSARGWRLQVQPDQWRPGRYRGHGLDPGPRQRAATDQERERKADGLRRGKQSSQRSLLRFLKELR
jgi:phosphoglucomutase